MNSKKEVIAASLLAIVLAVGLGAISYGLFSGTPTPKLKSALDVFTQKGGAGINVSGGAFEPLDNVSISAYLTQGGVELEGRLVTFTIKKPDGNQSVETALTNGLGVAEADIGLLPSEGSVTGTWRILAGATVEGEVVNDTLDFQCQSQSARIDVFSEKNGVPSTSFLPNATVLLEAQLSYRNASIAGTPVTFDVRTPNGTEFPLAVQTVSTNSSGTANTIFQIPWPSDSSLGFWQISASSEVYGQSLRATTNFECDLMPLVVDVFTPKGGIGPNTPGGYFALNETVVLYFEIRNGLNQTMPNQLISFAITDPNGKPFDRGTETTNSSGIAEYTPRVSPDTAFVGTFVVYASMQYHDIVLIDTLTFVVEQI
jgi:hypothetical protein